VTAESPGTWFSEVAGDYDAFRPAYPPELYDLVEQTVGRLADRRVLDLGAGTGLATRALRERGARVVSADLGFGMIQLLRSQDCGREPAVVARAERLPFRAGSFDVVTSATAWHWFDGAATAAEVRRVTDGRGWLGLWWGNAELSDDVDWELAQGEVFARWDLGSHPVSADPTALARGYADVLREAGLWVARTGSIGWSRIVGVEDHVRLLGTHSIVLRLGGRRLEFLDEVRHALDPFGEIRERFVAPYVFAGLTAAPG